MAYVQEAYDLPEADHYRVTHHQIRSWMVSLMEDGIGERTVNRKLSALKTYFKFLRKQGIVSKDPVKMVMAPKTPDRLPTFIEKGKMESLFKLLDADTARLSPEERFPRLRNRLILELLYGTGMRRAELIGLRPGDFNRANGTLRVMGKGNKERILPCGENLATLIKAYLELKTTLFVEAGAHLLVTDKGKALYPKFVYRLVSKSLKLVTTAEKKSPHVLRHTFATHLSNNGADLGAIKELLGHGSLASTQVYTHNSIARLKEIHKNAHPRSGE